MQKHKKVDVNTQSCGMYRIRAGNYGRDNTIVIIIKIHKPRSDADLSLHLCLKITFCWLDPLTGRTTAILVLAVDKLFLFTLAEWKKKQTSQPLRGIASTVTLFCRASGDVVNVPPRALTVLPTRCCIRLNTKADPMLVFQWAFVKQSSHLPVQPEHTVHIADRS